MESHEFRNDTRTSTGVRQLLRLHQPPSDPVSYKGDEGDKETLCKLSDKKANGVMCLHFSHPIRGHRNRPFLSLISLLWSCALSIKVLPHYSDGEDVSRIPLFIQFMQYTRYISIDLYKGRRRACRKSKTPMRN